MNIKKVLKATLFLTLVFAMQSMTTSKGVTGTWVFEAPNAPYEFAEGEIVIKKAEGVYSSIIKFEYNSITIDEIKVTKNNIVTKFDMQGQTIVLSMEVKGNVMTGVAETPEGDIEFTAKRK